jgi:peptide/nickel transport system permease protein
MTATIATTSARRVTWTRRRKSVARVWKQFAANRAGLFGLIVLVVVGLLAILAPVLSNADGLNVTMVNGPLLSGPTAGYLLGTDNNGR